MEGDGMDRVLSCLELIEEIESHLSNYRHYASKIPELERRLEVATKELLSEMRLKDVVETGNYGFEGRLLVFIQEMRKRIRGAR